METYYLKLKVVPTTNNEKFNEIAGAFACCWILEDSPDTAYRKAIFYVKKYDWKIEAIEIYPSVVKRSDFARKNMGIQNYDKAQKDGMAFVYVAFSRDGKTSFGPIRLNSSLKFDLDTFLNQIKNDQSKGRCLHFDSGIRCTKIIKAHSVQENHMLSQIQVDGHVYTLDSSFSSLKRHKGKLSYKKTGIGIFSIFRGFCEKHDNKLFKSIDTLPLIPTDQQVFLYAYRSLCKELFVKENALNTFKSQLEKGINQNEVKALLVSMELGTRFGLENLKTHKIRYDDSLKNNRFEKIRYVLFTSNQKPNIAFSGGIFPDFDFIGRQLQNLGDHSSSLELITFCSTPINSGWGYLFAWHESKSKICEEYIKSLATAIHEKRSAEDFLFRLAITSENHAIAPNWWESLTADNKNKIIEKTSETINIFSETPCTYLMKGVEGISGWKFDGVVPNY